MILQIKILQNSIFTTLVVSTTLSSLRQEHVKWKEIKYVKKKAVQGFPSAVLYKLKIFMPLGGKTALQKFLHAWATSSSFLYAKQETNDFHLLNY